MKVLIVDDSDLLQIRLAKAIHKVDEYIKIYQAYSCKEAIELSAPLYPDIIILDISLPDGSGIDLLKQFKNDDPGVMVLIFTNYPTDEFKSKCLEMGADQFFDKSSLTNLVSFIEKTNSIIPN